MPLQLEITSDHKDILGDDCVRVFREDGGTIGRSLENDWILPDPDKYISGKHATIDFQTGAYYLADVSSNGVYVNGDEAPLGNGNPRRLFDGDSLRMGDFEFAVTLDEGQSLDMPPPEAATVVPDHIEQLVPEDHLKSGIQMLDEEELTGDEAFQSTLFGPPSKKEEPQQKKKEMSNHANPFAPAPSESQQAAMQAAELLDAFMTGLDITRAEIHPSTDPLEVMHNAGRVLKEFVDGTSDLLGSRTALKSMFRLDQTTVLPRHNNPLKLAENTRDSMMQLLVGKEGEYLSPIDAVREVCLDLKYHQDAVLEAMISAFAEFSDKFDPDELQQNFDKALNKKPLFKAINQMKYWQLYCDLYPIMTQSSSGKFPHQFSEEFVRSYEKHIAEYKRLERHGDAPKKRPVEQVPEASFDGEELVDQTAEAGYADQF
ncbi:MAG: putative component of type VI protein secretion system [Woeseiaceae bacterium]|jgi:predicted component of type VI protein secretion system